MNRDIHNQNDEPNLDFLKESAGKNAFRVPENYFEKLPVEIADKIHSGAAERVSSPVLRPVFIGLTALCAIIITIGLFYFNSTNYKELTQPRFSYNDLDSSGYIASMDENLITDELAGQNIQIEDASPASAETDQIKDYLIDNNTDITLIINEL